MKDFSFADSVDTFDEHISSAIPGYKDLYYIVLRASEYFCQKDTYIYDLWCSTGRLLSDMVASNEWIFVWLDIEDKFKVYHDSLKGISFEYEDILNYEFKKSSLFLSLFTLQFLDQWEIDLLFKKIYSNLQKWGGLIFACKELSSNSFFQDLKTSLYWQKREESWFSIAEQFDKDVVLRKQMKLYNSAYITLKLEDIWFEVEEIWRNYNFAGYVCRKI